MNKEELAQQLRKLSPIELINHRYPENLLVALYDGECFWLRGSIEADWEELDASQTVRISEYGEFPTDHNSNELFEEMLRNRGESCIEMRVSAGVLGSNENDVAFYSTLNGDWQINGLVLDAPKHLREKE
jgi:hypothetical protein